MAIDTRNSEALVALETERRQVIARIGALECLLGQTRMKGQNLRRGGLVALNLQDRQGMKMELAPLVERLRLLNSAIKSGRRSGALLLLNGHPAPTDARELVAALYRLLVDAVPPAEQDDRHRAILVMARDYVMTGPPFLTSEG